MAASEAAAADPAALASGAPAVLAAARGAAVALGPWVPPGRLRGSRPRPPAGRQQPAGSTPPARKLIHPSVSELSRAVRTNILCTVRGCGKILPKSPALNMHLVKSHRLQDGISHIYRTGHEIPAEHRDPSSKKRKMENCLHSQKLSRKTAESLSNQPIPRPDAPELETSEIKLVASFEDSCSSNAKQQTLPAAPRYPQKLLLPKPKVALVKLPIMQFSPVPVFVPAADSSAQPVLLGVDQQGSAPGAVHLLPLSIGTLILGLDSEACSLKESLPLSKVVNPVAVEPISTETQTDGISTAKNLPALESKVQLNTAETQTMNSGFETLGSLFFTSNETQTAMDDFLLADLAWNTMESQFSSVETQTCAELHPVSNF
uniref:Uncharacterized protein n=1 Tax=Rangifer tarandus platyrhynchus TaxID=3082113 RepID=A0ACB0F9M1_RANTA|nr:unnamed protein product [Rangifer tarandus platyrhynchus]